MELMLSPRIDSWFQDGRLQSPLENQCLVAGALFCPLNPQKSLSICYYKTHLHKVHITSKDVHQH